MNLVIVFCPISQLTHRQKRLKSGEPLITLKLATGNITSILVSLAQGLIDVLDIGESSTRPTITKDKKEEKGY